MFTRFVIGATLFALSFTIRRPVAVADAATGASLHADAAPPTQRLRRSESWLGGRARPAALLHRHTTTVVAADGTRTRSLEGHPNARFDCFYATDGSTVRRPTGHDGLTPRKSTSHSAFAPRLAFRPYGPLYRRSRSRASADAAAAAAARHWWRSAVRPCADAFD